MRDRGVLIGTAGRYGNIMKIRRLRCMNSKHIDFFIDTLEKTLAE